VFVLARTSNTGARDFQELTVRAGDDAADGAGGVDKGTDGTRDDGDGRRAEDAGVPLYEHVARRASDWNDRGNVGLVVGATAPEELAEIRERVPELPFLVPGVGAQGGDAEAAVAYGLADGVGLVNSSRGIIFAGEGSEDPDAYFRAAGEAAGRLKRRLNEFR
jgi:orotidine-5'-phosphate decarboxylase